MSTGNIVALSLLVFVFLFWLTAWAATVVRIIKVEGVTTIRGVAWLALLCVSSGLGMLLYWFLKARTEELATRLAKRATEK